MRNILQELDERFIIGLDQKVLTDSKLIFFKIQKAFWYYKDHFESEIRARNIPNIGMDVFGQLLIEESALLSRIYPHDQREVKFREWQDFLRRVPRLGAICLNPSLTRVLMIQPFGKNKQNLQFPRGKLHAGEAHVTAAVREVWEECGIRLENLIDPELFFEALIDGTLHKLYVVFPVMEELVPSIQCNKEIEAILWVPLEELPGWTNLSDSRKFFAVAPFVPQIRAFVARMARTHTKRLDTHTRAKRVDTQKYDQSEAHARAKHTHNEYANITKILQRPPQPEPESSDHLNQETFGTESGAWSFEEMMSANDKLFGVKSSYTNEAFQQAYGASNNSALSLSLQAVMDAFLAGWNNLA